MTTDPSMLLLICPWSPRSHLHNLLLVPLISTWDLFLKLWTTSLGCTKIGTRNLYTTLTLQDLLPCHSLFDSPLHLAFKLPSPSALQHPPACPFLEQDICQGPLGSTFHLDPSPQGSSPPILWLGQISESENPSPPSLNHMMVTGLSTFSGGEQWNSISLGSKKSLLTGRRY